MTFTVRIADSEISFPCDPREFVLDAAEPPAIPCRPPAGRARATAARPASSTAKSNSAAAAGVLRAMDWR